MKVPVIKKGAKVGIHALQASSFKWVEEAVRRGLTWPVVKSVGDVAWLKRVKEISPATITVARVAHNLDGIGEGLTGVEHVKDNNYNRFVDLLYQPILSEISHNPDLKGAIDYWEICNEPDPPGANGYRNMAECMVQCIDRAEQLGIKLALFALNAGTPEWNEIEAMLETDVFKRARAGGHIISVHEGVFIDALAKKWGEVDQWYGGAIPTTDQHDPNTKWVQLNGEQFMITPAGDPSLRELPKHIYTAGPLNFRYRYWLQRLREAGQAVPFLVSEIRLGATVHYADRLPWYDERAAHDPELLGFLPFTWSPYDSSHWGDADMEAASEVVLSYMERVKGRENALPKDDGDNEPLAPTGPDDPDKPTEPEEPDEPTTPVKLIRPVEPVIESIDEALDTALAHPSRLHVPPNSGLHRRVERDGLRIASSEMRMEIDDVDSVVLLASDATYQKHALYFVKFGDWRDEAIQVYDPQQLLGDGEKPITHALVAWPTDFKLITQEFGARPAFYRQFDLPGHEGVDIRAPLGAEIRAAYAGKVIHRGNRRISDKRRISNYGWHVWIERENGERWVYGHLRADISVAENDEVRSGDIIGFSGNSGQSSGPHLHLGLQIPGARARGDTDFPHDFVDPTARLLSFEPSRPFAGGYLEYKKPQPVYPTAIDTSKFRPNIRWDSDVLLNEQNIYCVMPRASQGSTPDPEFVPTMNRLMAARARGEKFVIIPFHDVNPWHPADVQADVFQAQVAKFGGWRAWMFDVEAVPAINRPLPTEQQVQDFVDAVEARIGSNRPKLYYSSKRYMDKVSQVNTFGADLMLAAYGVRDPLLPVAYERLGKSWTFHQHTESYNLKGYTTITSGDNANSVDQSFFNGTVDELFAWEAGTPTVPPTDPLEPEEPEEPDQPDPPTVINRAERINLLPYWQGKIGWAHNVQSFRNSHEHNETVQTIMLDDGRWGILKNRNMQTYFLREYQGRMFIWQGPDTSPGNNRFYVTFMNGDVGSPVCPLEMAVGETWRSDHDHWVQFYDLNSGSTSSLNSGPMRNWITFHAHHSTRTFANGITLEDVIEIGNNEIHFMARDRTLVGWRRLHDDPHTPQSAQVSELHSPFSRRPDPQPIPHFVMPNAAKAF